MEENKIYALFENKVSEFEFDLSKEKQDRILKELGIDELSLIFNRYFTQEGVEKVLKVWRNK